jgi:hypothetical protein
LSAWLATRRPLELHDISFWVADVDRWALPFGSVPSCQWPRLHVVCFKLTADGCFIERLDAKAEVIEVPSFPRRWCTTGSAKLTIHWHEVDQRAPRTKLYQPNRVLTSFDRAPKHAAVEAKHAVEVDHAQHNVVNLTDVNHVAWSGWLTDEVTGDPPRRRSRARGASVLTERLGILQQHQLHRTRNPWSIVGRQGPATENVHRTCGRGLVARRWRSA